MEKIIVLGAAGNIGSVVLQHLQSRDAAVYAGVLHSEDIAKVRVYQAEPVIVDFTQADSLKEALQGKDRVFLVTPIMRHPEKVTEQLVQVAEAQGLKHIVRSTAAGADAQSPYTLLRDAGRSEEVLKAAKINHTIIRPGTFLQNFVNWSANSIKEFHGFYQPVGDARMCMLDLDNLGEVVAQVMFSEQHYNQTYTLTGHVYRQQEIADILTALLGRKISYIPTTLEQARQSMQESHTPDWMMEALIGLNEATIAGHLDIYAEDYRQVTGKDYTDAKTFFKKHINSFQ